MTDMVCRDCGSRAGIAAEGIVVCRSCGGRVLSKPRPPIVKRVVAR